MKKSYKDLLFFLILGILLVVLIYYTYTMATNLALMKANPCDLCMKINEGMSCIRLEFPK